MGKENKKQSPSLLGRQETYLKWSIAITFTVIVMVISMLQSIAGKGEDILATDVLTYGLRSL